MSNLPPGYVPAGTILAYGGPDRFDVEVSGWTACNGAALDPKRYPELFKAIGYSNGQDEKTGNFKVPDLRGLFLRGKQSPTNP
jgi:microcystin-dependent protein